MANTLTEYLSSLGRRTDALEGELSNAESISRITKSYQNFRVSFAVVSHNTHTYKLCSTTLICGTGVIL